MDWLYNLDLELYRAIHVDLRREWLSPLMLIISQSGLGHVQLGLLLPLIVRPHLKWLLSAVLAILLAGWAAIVFYRAEPEWTEVFVYQTVANGVGLMLLLSLGASFIQLDLRRYALPMLYSGILAGLVRLVVMRIVARPRPSNLDFSDPLDRIFANTSFPSGHATTSFAIAFILWLRTRGTDAAWVGRLAIAWSVVVGFTRVYIGVHWPSDVIGGAGLGLACASVVWLSIRETESGTREEGTAPHP